MGRTRRDRRTAPALSMRRRVVAGFVVLLTLFLAVVLIQLFVSDRLQVRTQARADVVRTALDANRAVLQYMTDAETGVRGFQITGERAFLQPYEKGRVGALGSLDVIERNVGDERLRGLVTHQREAAASWLTGWAAPIVTAGVADRDETRAARGRAMFDALRTANAGLDDALRQEQLDVTRDGRRDFRLAQLAFGGLAAVFLTIALILAVAHQKHLLGPLEHIRLTLQRLAAGDLSARAVRAGPQEMRAVIGSLNDLAARTERLLDAEQARSVRNELRQAVAAALRDPERPVPTARRVAALVGEALGADAVHGRVTVESGRPITVAWPSGAASLSPRTVNDILAGTPNAVLDVPGVAGALAVALGGDADCPPGLIYLVRHHGPEWSADERRLVGALAREIDHAVRQQRLQLRQERLISELRVLDERKDAFVSTVTHELRTPLTSILGYLEMLSDGDGGELSPLQRRGVDAITRNAVRLQDTVADLLLLDSAHLRGEVPETPVDLAAAAAAALAEVTPAARAKNLQVTGEAGPAVVPGDAAQLERALRNLFDNAVKFTGPGGRIDWRLTADDGTATFTVTDTGIGIPAADQPGLFTPFHRAANAMDQAVQGSGLGLAIVHNIVTEHRGAVAVSSVAGRGSTFTVTLPLLSPLPAAASARSGHG